ncbi:MAG TPA: tyrosine-protein phosphatase [Pyrinomonadaceae bacterium]|nr:tyrosine-protein phosphatase [Pyrinomonadaceae bacterium]
MKFRHTRRQKEFPPAYRLAPLLAVALLASLAGLGGAAQSVAPPQVGIKNFGKVNDNYYRGSQPGAAQFAGLKGLGVRTVIDLRKDSLEEAPEQARGAGLQYFNIPLTTKRPATAEQTEQFLKLVNDPANWPVYVHCKGGRHRTGQMTAIYRITQDGWTAREAYEEMKRYDFEDSFFYPRSLKKHVFSYYENFVTEKATGAAVPASGAAQ